MRLDQQWLRLGESPKSHQRRAEQTLGRCDSPAVLRARVSRCTRKASRSSGSAAAASPRSRCTWARSIASAATCGRSGPNASARHGQCFIERRCRFVEPALLAQHHTEVAEHARGPPMFFAEAPSHDRQCVAQQVSAGDEFVLIHLELRHVRHGLRRRWDDRARRSCDASRGFARKTVPPPPRSPFLPEQHREVAQAHRHFPMLRHPALSDE